MKKDIKDYEGLYSIDENGVVYSTPSDGKKPKILKQEIIVQKHTSYRRVSLSKKGKVKRFQVHRLVAIAFVTNKMNKPQIDHKDNNGENNHYLNLRWVTGKENMKHSFNQGRQDHVKIAGGIATGKIQTAKAKTKYDGMIGAKFGRRMLLSIREYGKHPKGVFICLDCKKHFNGDIGGSIRSKSYRACRSCSLKENKRVKI